MHFSVRETARERRQVARACARDVLGMGENRMLLVLAGLVCTTVSFLALFAVWAMSYAIHALPIGEMFAEGALLFYFLRNLIILGLFWLLAMPLWLGAYRMAIRMMDGETVGGKDLFYYVMSGDAYVRALGLAARMILRFLPACLGFLILQAFFALDLIGLLLVCIFAITLLVSLLWSGSAGGFVTLALTDDQLSTSRAIKMATKLTAGERMPTLTFHLGITLRVLISLLAVGVPLLLHTFPMAMLSSVAYVRRMAAGL